MSMRICIVHKGERPLVTRYFSESEHSIYEVPFSDNHMEKLTLWDVDIVVIDVIQGGESERDLEVVECLQQITSIPLFLVAGSSSEAQYREKMFNAGVDGCVQIPFMKEELIARLKILIHKNNYQIFTGTTLASGDVQMNIRTHEVEAGGRKLNLTKIEYSILFHLLLHRQSVVRMDELRIYGDRGIR